MPYEYRKLSPKEREEIVNYRRERGFPLHAPPHPFREAGVYMISVANFEHQAIMNSTKRRTDFEIRLLNAIKEITDELIAWIVLPNHYHVKHGYISDPYEWPWSSLAIYYADKGKGWLQEHWKSYTPSEDFGRGWDDIEND